MYEIVFYHSRNGKSEIEEYLDELGRKAKTSKTDRINRMKILSYLNALTQYGTRIGQPIVKHIEGNIWELRPLNNRIFFFYWRDNKFVLLHHFIKKSQKTPPQELEQARVTRSRHLKRRGLPAQQPYWAEYQQAISVCPTVPSKVTLSAQLRRF